MGDQTILVTHWNQDTCLELEIVCQRTIDLLFETLRCPFVFPGAGCIEAVILHRLPCLPKNAGLRRGVYHLIKSSNNYEKADLMTDLEYGHLWEPEKDHCQCGFISKGEQELSELIPLQPPHEEIFEEGTKLKPKRSQLVWPLFSKTVSGDMSVKQRIIVDHYVSKTS